MPNFTPAGIVRIGRVPFDNSYRNTLAWQSKAGQESYFASVCTKRLEKDSYTYVRMSNSIKVPFNAEELYTYNYVMYQNANYGSKWFYAFIVGVNYVNKSTTELELELDVMQTWFFDYHHNQCFVEREHVSDDTIGAHLNPEPPMSLEYAYSFFNAQYMQALYTILMVNAYPHWNVSGTDVMGSDPVEGGVYHGQYNACKMLVYKMFEKQSRDKLAKDIKAFNASGAADTIADAFTVDHPFLSDEDIEPLRGDSVGDAGTYEMKTGTDVPETVVIVRRPSDLNGYMPRNKKLLTYPYCYCEVGDYTGRATDYRFEFFAEDGTAEFRVKAPCCSDTTLYFTPKSYNGGDAERSASVFTADVSNKVSWVYSAYQTWAAQNAVANQLAVLGGVAATTMALMPSIGKAAGALSTPGRIVSSAHPLGYGKPRYVPPSDTKYMGAELSADVSVLGALGGAGSVAGTFANVDRMSKVPNRAQGSTSGNARFQSEYAGYYSAVRCLLPEFARIVDRFFDMYGYQVDLVGRPNWNNRRNWNYIKCSGANHSGDVPAEDMALINSIYDQGFTYWHDPSTYGDYTQPNDIVSR